MRSRLLSVALGISMAAAAAGLVGCGGSSPQGVGSSSKGDGSSPKGDVNTAFDKTLQATILVDNRGRTLYVFDMDGNNEPTCYDDATFHCSKGWPPLLVHGAVNAGGGVDGSLLTTVKRTDGTVQVSYNRHPLYTFVGFASGGNAPPAPGDTKPGDLNGQSYVALWWVLSPAGKPIKTKPSGSG
jgi:predicted lipoprotein with Yx(FWY)xxD motif